MEFDYCLPYPEENNIIYKNSLLINIYILFLCSTMLLWFSFMYRNLEKRCVTLELELQSAYENKDAIEVSSDESESDNGEEVFKRIIQTDNENLSEELIERKQSLLEQLLSQNNTNDNNVTEDINVTEDNNVVNVTEDNNVVNVNEDNNVVNVNEFKLERKSKSDSDLIQVDKNIQPTLQPSYIDIFSSYFVTQ